VGQESRSDRRARRVRVAATAGVAIAGTLVVYGLTRPDDERSPATDTPPTIGAIQSPAQVVTTLGPLGVPIGTTATTEDVPIVPTGTADIPFTPPITSDIPTP
jgi:hypothetical protein